MGPLASFLLFLLEAIIATAQQGPEATSLTKSPPFLPHASVLDKEGWCPPGQDRAIPPARVYCLWDASCPGGEKCCTLGTMQICMHPAMVGQGYCPLLCPSVEEPCLVGCLDDTWCGPGEKCCQVDCHIRCVPAEPARPGICPRKRILADARPCANRCVDDRSCPEGQKCCFTGCGLDCVAPVAVSPPCAEASLTIATKRCANLCVDDTDCTGNSKCKPTDCGFQCKASQPEKEGVCPARAPPGAIDPCFGRCSNDYQCPGKMKCCKIECGVACLEPVSVKPGACPLQLRGSMGPCPEPTQKNCSSDFDCEAAQKCCPIGCKSICREPEEVRPGSCPLVAAETVKAPACLSMAFCVRDNDCSQPHEKCCWHRCGWVCVAATDDDVQEPLSALS